MATGLRYDAFYMTRKQKERMKEGTDADRYPTIGPKFLSEQRFQDTLVMHPLPRVDELSPELDKDRRGIYFKQAAYGVPVRMALLKFLFDGTRMKTVSTTRASTPYERPDTSGPQCRNPNCVTLNEAASTRKRFELFSLGKASTLILGCLYCDHRFKVQFIGHAKSKRYCSCDSSMAEAMETWLNAGELVIFDSIKEAEELGYEPFQSGPERTLMSEVEIQRSLAEMSRQILRDCRDPDRLLILGVRSAGSRLAQRIADEIERERRRKVELGEIELYGSGDELKRLSPADPEMGPFNLKDREVILIDDVIHTGRTVKSALSIIFRSGRPQSVRLAVLIDRGHREVPVKPNYVGKNIPSSEKDRVRVRLRGLEQAERDQVVIYSLMTPLPGAVLSVHSDEQTEAS
jgi:pyrimidine operon attenuation protein/uracil phosphoribosyltransferase